MADVSELHRVIEDLIEIVRLQTTELQRLIAHVEGQTVHLPQRSQVPLLLSELSELRSRVRKMAESTLSE
jgi:hypothetical protein